MDKMALNKMVQTKWQRLNDMGKIINQSIPLPLTIQFFHQSRFHLDLFRFPLCVYRISPSISRETSDNFENANLGVRPILGSRKMSSLTTRQTTKIFANESSFVAADKFSEQ